MRDTNKASEEFNPVKRNESLPVIEWEDFDRVGKEKDRRIKKQGAEDGSFGIPSGKTLSDTENEILADAHEYQHRLAHEGGEYFEKLESRVNSYKDFLNQENFKTILNSLRARAQNRIDNKKLKLSELATEYNRNKREYEQFRRINQLDRMSVPTTLLKSVFYLAFIAVLFVVEVVMNARLVSGVLPGGTVEGVGLTFGVAFVNVLISFAVGYYFLKNINHISSGPKSTAWLIFAVYMILIFYLNWAYGAFRGVAEQIASSPEILELDKISLSLQKALSPWEVPLTFQSLVISVLGFAFAVFSLLDGYLFDDIYPDYGRKARMLSKSREKILSELKRLVSGVQRVFTDGQREGREMKETLALTLNAWSNETNLLQTRFDSYRKKILNAENDINHMLREYMIANKGKRELTEYPLPERFEDKAPFSYEDHEKDPSRVFEVSSDVYMEDAQRRQKREKVQKDIEENYSTFTTQVSELREKILKSVKEIQGQYENI